MTTWRGDKWDDRLLIWNWKTGVLHVNMRVVRVPSTELYREPTYQFDQQLMGFEPVFAFL